MEKILKLLEVLRKKIDCLFSMTPVATIWTPNHSNITGNRYLKDTMVYYEGNVYKCLVPNNGTSVTNPYFWHNLGPGYLLQQEQADWNATEGPSFIRNKPFNLGGEETDPIFSNWLESNPLANYATQSWVLSNFYPLTNPSGYIDSSALSPYLLSSTATSTYFPKPTGTTSEYIKGDGSLGTFPTIPTIPTEGYLKHTIASGTDTYTTSITGVTTYNDGDAYLVRFTNGNTTGCTLNINSLGAITLYRNNDGALLGGDIQDGAEMLCVYNSSLNIFQCIGTSPNSLFAYVTNADTVPITKGMPVYAFGGTGDRMTVKRAYNTSDATSAQTVGLVLSSSIGVNQKGLIIIQGLLDGLSILPTSTYSDGDPIYLGATAGTITKTKPYAPNHLVYLGVVTTASNGSAGRMYVRVQNGYELDELHNVQAQNPNNNDTIYYDSSVSQWKTASLVTILGYTPENIANKSSSYTASSTTTYANTKALVDGLATKENTLGYTPENVANKENTTLDTSTTKYPTNNLVKTNIDAKVTANVAITGATKTKITYDSKGLVTSGADATTADIADSLNKRYVTDAQLTVIGNTSGTNTGDENDLKIRRGGYTLFTDFMTTTSPQGSLVLAPFSAGTIAINNGIIDADHPGVVNFLSSSSAGSGYGISTLSSATNGGIKVSMNGLQADAIIRTPSSSFASTATIRLGLVIGTIATEPTDGCYMQFDDTGNLVGKTANGSVRSSTSTYALSIATWYHFRIVVNSSSLVTFYVFNMAGTQLFSATLSTNMPSTSTALNFSLVAWQNTATTTTLVSIDYVGFTIPSGSTRGALT